MVFDALDGGADDEITLKSNRAAFSRVTFRPRPLVDVSSRDHATTVLGQKIALPVMFAPTGSGRLVHSEAELLLAREAARSGMIYTHGSVASFSLEDVAAQGEGALWYQLYLPPDRAVARDLIKRVYDAGYRALVLTIDTPVRGHRTRDARNRFELPYRITPHLIMQGLSRPAWSMRFLLTNASRRKPVNPTAPKKLSLGEVKSALIAARWPATWADVEFVRQTWPGPLLVKGILRGDECPRIVDLGVDGIVVSNHGGRQLDGAPATIDVLPEVVDAVAGRAEIFLDGGVRRGSDIVKAVALGAKACFVGRPYLYALAAGGERGLARLVDIFRKELDRTMALVGCSSIADIDRSLINSAPAERRLTTQP